MDDNSLWVIALVVGGFLALILALNLLALVLWGAILVLNFASFQGFLGLVAYVAAWVFLFPVMLGASLLVGFLSWRAEARKEREQRNLPRRARPPSDPVERDKWANRLPPYDD